ncbi:MAG: diaminopimelate epimerase [Alphaproteobacteria bacterium]|nr:diaminopimelate epimerase [Alphaproteobacteria bacterium]
MKFYKMNGAGNAFVVFDARSQVLRLDPERIRQIADPTDGAGADQVIVMERSLRGDVFMRIWNSDGSEVSACGNASRCVGWLMMEETGADRTRIETAAGPLTATRVGANLISVDMGSPLLRWEEIPLSVPQDTRALDTSFDVLSGAQLGQGGCVNMGNPHVVFFIPDLDSLDIPGIGPRIEHHPLFPQAVNVGFAQVLSRDRIRLRVWERGAGLTRACGTGACAAVVAAVRRELADRQTTVIADGGELGIHWHEDTDRVLMTGPVELEYESRF